MQRRRSNAPRNALLVCSDSARALNIAYFGLLCWQGVGEALYSWELSEATMGTVRFPLFPARFVLAAGTFLLLVQLALDVFDDLSRMVRGEAAAAAATPQNFQ